MACVTIIEYGIGNIASVVNACARVGAEPVVVSDGSQLRAATPSHIIMPGVGAIGEALGRLRERGLEEALSELVVSQGAAFLGICVGMQVMAETCEEFGQHRGLGWIPGRVRRLAPAGSDLRLPHVGWNTIEGTQPGDPLLQAIDGKDVYFVHSYAVETSDDCVLARTEYGSRFVSAVRRGRTYGVQFHPEKSSTIGDALLRAFVAL